MEYSYLLDQANKCDDPYMRMVYACENLVSVISEYCITKVYFVKFNNSYTH